MFKLLIAATLLVGALGHPLSNLGGRVVNGTDAKLGEIPYIVSIRSYGSHNCGGSLIATNWVLTAAHCSTGSVSSMSIQYGVLEISPSGSNVLNVLSKIVHEKYNPSTIRDDIALLQLDGHVTLSENVALVNLPTLNQDVPGWSNAVLAGWGYPYSGGGVMKHLQRVDIFAYPQDECIKAHGSRVFESNICGGVPEGGKGQCSGDSGGPLTAGGVQVGLVSWSVKPCTIKGYPGVYTRVPFYIDWIEKNMQI